MWSEKCDSIKSLDTVSCHSVRKAQLRVPIFCGKHERPLLGSYIPVAFQSRMTALGRSCRANIVDANGGKRSFAQFRESDSSTQIAAIRGGANERSCSAYRSERTTSDKSCHL